MEKVLLLCCEDRNMTHNKAIELSPSGFEHTMEAPLY